MFLIYSPGKPSRRARFACQLYFIRISSLTIYQLQRLIRVGIIQYEQQRREWQSKSEMQANNAFPTGMFVLNNVTFVCH